MSARITRAAVALATLSAAMVLSTAGPAAAAAPSNDNFANAAAIPAIPGSVAGSNVDATLQAGEEAECGPIGATVWYRFTASQDAVLAFDTFDSELDTIVAVYRGSSLASLDTMGCNDDDGGGGLQSRVAVAVTSGVTYHVQVGGYDGEEGDFSLAVSRSGSITGRVTAEDGTPIPDVCVDAYDEGSDTGAWGFTDADGRYALGVAPGTYRVEFWDCSDEGGFAGEWYDDQQSYDAADPVTVEGFEIVGGIDAVLSNGGSISGTVVDGSANAVAGVCVAAWTTGPEAEEVGFGYTGEDGGYVVAGLPTGAYALRFFDCEGSLASEWYDDAARMADATPVPVTEGAEITGVDAELTPGGSIEGVGTGPEGEPIEQVCVSALDPDGFHAASGWAQEGAYEILGLHAGSYRLLIEDCGSGELLAEWYEDQPSFDEADEVAVVEGAVTTGIDAQLGRGGSIEGRVTDPEGDPVEWICVDVYDQHGDVVDEELTDEDGRYRADGLAGGVYRVSFYPCDEIDLEPEWFEDEADFERADPVSVTVGAVTSGIDAALGRPAVLVAESEGGTLVDEGGAADSYTVRLGSIPGAPVQVVASDAAAQVAIEPSTLVFTAADWAEPRTVMVTAVDDAEAEEPVDVLVGHAVTSADEEYDGIGAPGVRVRVQDDDLVARPTRITYQGPTAGTRGQTVAASATLLEEGTFAPVAGAAVEFALGTVRRTAVTDATGRASVGVPLTLAPGQYVMTATWAGSPFHLASRVDTPFEVRWEAVFEDQDGTGTIFLNASTKEFELVRGAFRSGIRSEPGMRTDALAGGATLVTFSHRAGELVVNGAFELGSGRFSANGRTAGTDVFVLRRV